jgi:hypothetical protein
MHKLDRRYYLASSSKGKQRGQLLAPREPGRAPEGHVVLEVRVNTAERLDCWNPTAQNAASGDAIYVLVNLLAVPAFGLKVWSKLVDVLQTEEGLAYLQACTDMPILVSHLLNALGSTDIQLAGMAVSCICALLDSSTKELLITEMGVYNNVVLFSDNLLTAWSVELGDQHKIMWVRLVDRCTQTGMPLFEAASFLKHPEKYVGLLAQGLVFPDS